MNLLAAHTWQRSRNVRPCAKEYVSINGRAYTFVPTPSRKGPRDMAEKNDQSKTATITNTNRWETRQLVIMALMAAICVLLSFIEIPILPAAPWLKYDPSFVPAMVTGCAYGAGPGVAVGLVSVILHIFMTGNFWGGVMNVLAVCAYVIPTALIYKKMHTWKGAVLGLVAGSICAIVISILANLVVTPIYAGIPVEGVIAMILPILIPFNVMKVVLNSVLTLAVYKAISNLITPKKDQVQGR